MIDLSSGACAGLADATYAIADPFYPEPGKGRPTNHDPYAEAKRICDGCPIRDLCLQDALTETVQWGYRAGLTPEQRQQLKQGRQGIHRPGHPSDADLEARMAAYHSGLNDAEIGAQLGVTDKTITAWRKRNALPPNHPPHRAHTPAQNLIKQHAYDNGATDFEIAIRKWRLRLSLPVNPVRPRETISA